MAIDIQNKINRLIQQVPTSPPRNSLAVPLLERFRFRFRDLADSCSPYLPQPPTTMSDSSCVNLVWRTTSSITNATQGSVALRCRTGLTTKQLDCLLLGFLETRLVVQLIVRNRTECRNKRIQELGRALAIRLTDFESRTETRRS